MSYVTIWFIAFLLDGTPVPMTQIVKGGDMCSDAYATQLVHEVAQKSSVAFQDLVLWRCEMFTSPGPAAPLENAPNHPPLPNRDAT